MREKGFRKLRKMLKDNSSSCCPSCNMPYDKGKKRRLTDTCGHQRCYCCIFSSDQCPLCLVEAKEKASQRKSTLNNPTLTNDEQIVKTNGHFKTHWFRKSVSKKKGGGGGTNTGSCPGLSDLQSTEGRVAQLRSTPGQIKRPARPNTVNIDGQLGLNEISERYHRPANVVRRGTSSLTLDNGPSPTSGDSLHPSDLYARLNLLQGFGDNLYDVITASKMLLPNRRMQNFQLSRSLCGSEASISSRVSPASTLTVSSSVENYPQSGHLRNGSRNHSVASLTSVAMESSCSEIPLVLSSNTGKPDIISSSEKMSSRMSTHSKESSSSTTTGGQNLSYTRRQLALKPLFFEVPQPDPGHDFVGREWLFAEIERVMADETQLKRGVAIVGSSGSGKSSIILELVDHSPFGRKFNSAILQGAQELCSQMKTLYAKYLDGDQASLNGKEGSFDELNFRTDAAQPLGRRVVAYHFCQADYNATCSLPEFIHNMAAQLCQAPQLGAYRKLLLKEPRYEHLLSISSCMSDPTTALVNGILEPLDWLANLGSIPLTECLLVVIDSLHEAEQHGKECGNTIASFLNKHLHKFPKWLKVVLTVRPNKSDVQILPCLHSISLDRFSSSEDLQSDIYSYIIHRISSSPALRGNISASTTKGEGLHPYSRFASHLASTSKGCMLYVKLTLDLLQRGHLVIKSSSYNVLPVSLNEVFLLNFNLRFTTCKAFDRVSSILHVCLASLYPLTPLEVYHSVNAAVINSQMKWKDFLSRMETLTAAHLLVVRQDGSVMFAHSSLRDWLLRREENDNSKFLCDARFGHAMIALRQNRLEQPLAGDRCLEFLHHVSKAGIFKGTTPAVKGGLSTQNLEALFLQQSIEDATAALGSYRNLCNPDLMVSRQLLQAGANPDFRTDQQDNVPLIGFYANKGMAGMVSLLLEAGANCNATNESGQTPLSLASGLGHLEVAKSLVQAGGTINQKDHSGRCPLVHAASKGHFNIVSYLVQCDWSKTTQNGSTLVEAAQEAMVAAASGGQLSVCKYLLDISGVKANNLGKITGHTALTAACSSGHTDVCRELILKGAFVSTPNRQGDTPLGCAVMEGHWKVVEELLNHQAALEQRDFEGRTPLMLAAREGRLGVLELLVNKGASLATKDKNGLTALSWACVKGQLQTAQYLIDHGADVAVNDRYGRTPLDLAATNGDPDVVQLLLDRGALLEHVDLDGLRPLDRAIEANSVAAVARFLHRGAKLGPQTWLKSQGKLDITFLLLKKLLTDGILLYKKSKLQESAHRYQYALKKFPSDEKLGDSVHHFRHLKFQLHLGLSRCRRKMKDYGPAIKAAEHAAHIKPQAFEAYYARSRAKEEAGFHQDALLDVNEALQLPLPSQEVRILLLRLKDEILESLRSSCGSGNPSDDSVYTPRGSGASSELPSYVERRYRVSKLSDRSKRAPSIVRLSKGEEETAPPAQVSPII